MLDNNFLNTIMKYKNSFYLLILNLIDNEKIFKYLLQSYCNDIMEMIS